MTTLHTVNKSPFEKQSLVQCVSRLADDAGLLLIEDGVIAAVVKSVPGISMPTLVDRYRVFVLEPDLIARGYSKDDVFEGIECVDYQGFVRLTVDFKRVHSWC